MLRLVELRPPRGPRAPGEAAWANSGKIVVGGVDIADIPVYWLLPSGRVECWCLERLVDARPDELAAEEGREEYEALAAENSSKNFLKGKCTKDNVGAAASVAAQEA